MTENKQFTFDRDTVAPNIKTPIVFKEGERLSIGEVLDKLNELNNEKETYKMLWEEMSYYFEDGKELKDLDYKDFRALQRLAKGLVD